MGSRRMFKDKDGDELFWLDRAGGPRCDQYPTVPNSGLTGQGWGLGGLQSSKFPTPAAKGGRCSRVAAECHPGRKIVRRTIGESPTRSFCTGLWARTG